MGIIHRLVRWVKLTRGVGREMRERGATVQPCPHCGNDTPVYRSAENDAGEPTSFSVCLWCEGLIEYGSIALAPHHPYASTEEIMAANEEIRRRRRRYVTPPRYAAPSGPGRRRFDPDDLRTHYYEFGGVSPFEL